MASSTDMSWSCCVTSLSSLCSSSSPHCLSSRPNSTVLAAQHSPLPSPQLAFNRRLALPLLSFPLFLSPPSPALALDVPLFGIRKRVEEAQKDVAKQVKELVKGGQELVKEGQQLVEEGGKDVGGITGAVTALSPPSLGAGKSIPPAFQAAAVAGVELVAVLAAAAVVNSIVSEPRK